MTLRKCFGVASLSTLLAFSATVSAQQPSGSQQPQGWMWGFGVAASQDVYTDFDNRIVPIPIIGYTGEKLRVYGPFVGYQLFQQDGFTLDAQLVPVFAGYEEDDSAVFTGMEDRDFSYAAGIGLNYNTGGWVYSLSTNADIFGVFWLQLKLFFVTILTIYHFFLFQCLRKFNTGINSHSPRFYRIINEIPTILLILIIFIVVFKPL